MHVCVWPGAMRLGEVERDWCKEVKINHRAHPEMPSVAHPFIPPW